MEKNRIENNEINLFELIRYVLIKWKTVLILSVVLCVVYLLVLGVLEKNILPFSGEHEDAQISIEELTETQQQKVEHVFRLNKELEGMEYYRDASAYMNLNAYECNIGILQYLITDDSANGESYEVYKAFVENGGLKNIIEEKLGEEIIRPSDLVNIADNVQLDMGDGVINWNSNSSVLVVKVTTNDVDVTNRIVKNIKEAFEEYHEFLLSTIETHDIILLSENNYVGCDRDISRVQNEFVKEITEKKDALSECENALSESEKEVLESLKHDGMGIETKTMQSKKSFLLLILILLVCVFISCLIVACYYIFVFGNKLKNGEEAMSIFGIPYIGRISKRNPEANMLVLQEEIETLCLSQERKNVFVSSIVDSYNVEEHFSGIRNELAKKEIELIFGRSIIDDIEAIQAMKEYKNIIFVFENRKTTYRSMDKMFHKCYNRGVNIVGVIDID